MKKAAILFVILTMSIPCAAINDPVAHWKLDESSGLTAYDSVGSNDGTLIGGPVWDPNGGQVNGALDFDGSDDYVDCGDANSLKPQLPVTLCAWINVAELGTAGVIVSLDDNSTAFNGIMLRIGAGNHIGIVYGDGDGLTMDDKRNKGGTTTINPNTWYHVAGVIRGATDMDIYVNGVDDVGGYAGTGGPLYYTPSGHAYIGSRGDATYLFDGKIDDVRLYDRALSEQEVERLYFEGLGNLSVSPWEDFVSSGDIGGPFTPASKDYQLTNIGDDTVSWDVQYSAGWLDVSDTTGVLDPNEFVTVTVSINATADTLAGGLYTETLVFRDMTDANDIVEYRRDVTLVIGGDIFVPYQYPTIQSAINASNNGDTIIVAPGTYYENINFNGKNIILTSTDPTDPNIVRDTIIDAGNSGTVVTFSGTEISSCELTGFTITNGYAQGEYPNGFGGGIRGYGTEATISSCVISNNMVDEAGGGIADCDGKIIKCSINSNFADEGGGGLFWCDGVITNCAITGNSVRSGGGGLMYCNGAITNCTISVNSTEDEGGGLYSCDGSITNCTITGNTGSSGGGLSNCDGSITNCIIWGNAGNQVYASSGPTYSCIQGWSGGTGNISFDPLFVDPANDNYHLKPWSRCIDAGTNSPPGGLPPTDMDGNPRPIDGNNDGLAITDMGAYEAYPSAEPVIWLSDFSFDFTAEEDRSNPDGQILTIHNAGGAILNWSITESCGWLTVTPDNGSSTGEPNVVTLSVDISSLAWGNYNCQLTVSDPCAMNSPKTVSVGLEVIGPIIELSQSSFVFQADIAGPDPDDQILSITNTGGGTLDWSVTEACDWLTVTPDNGSSTGEPNEVILSVDIAGLTGGVYNCDLTITDPCAMNSPQVVTVNLDITGPIIELSQTSFNFTAEEDGTNPDDQILTIRNVGLGTLNWSITEDCDWLTVIPDSGSSAGEADAVILSVDITGLTEGQYTCDLTITDPNAENSPQIVNVFLAICSIYVPGDYPTIQSAIDAAFDGCTIIVAPGVYYERINFNGKNIILTSTDPDDFKVVTQTIIHGSYAGTTVTFSGSEGPGCVLEGFTITGGDNSGVRGNSAEGVIMKCYIHNNSDSWLDRGGIYNFDGLIENCIIAHNHGHYGGGGLDSCDGVIRNCTITGNYTEAWGGGLNECNGSIVNCIIWGNYADWWGDGDAFHNCSIPSYSCYPGAIGSNIDLNPLFSNTGYMDPNGTPEDPSDDHWVRDYHLMSKVGRWLPYDQYYMDPNGTPADPNDDFWVTVPGNTWVTDAVTSPCIDAGDPGSDRAGELWPHGGRINMGAYGGTAQASMSFNPAGKVADLNDSNDVDYADFGIFYTHWKEDTREIYEPNEVGWWEFDEGAGSTAYDSSVYGRDGTLINDPNRVTGKYGDALSFDSDYEEYVEVIGYKGILGGASRTCSAWIKTTSVTGPAIMSWGQQGIAGAWWIFRLENTGAGGTAGALRVQVQGGAIVGNTPVNDGQWHHVAAVLVDDGSPDVSEVKLYVDGVEETYSNIAGVPINTVSDQDVMIGTVFAGGNPAIPFDGSIDDVRIYDFALTDEMIQQIYQDQQPSGFICLEKPVGDLNNNCIVNLLDLLIFAENWLWEQ